MMGTGEDGEGVSVKPGKHIRAILLLPVMATVVIPALLTWLAATPRPGWSLPPPWHLLPLLLGCSLLGSGATLLVQSIRLLAARGRGTLAPWDPTRALVVHSVYRYVRNPMISGVLAILLGEALLLGSHAALGWFALFLIVNLAYMPLVEERALKKRFGADYTRYRENVPAWIPRLRPWDHESPHSKDGEPSRRDKNGHMD